jgi:hypothetical protein
LLLGGEVNFVPHDGNGILYRSEHLSLQRPGKTRRWGHGRGLHKRLNRDIESNRRITPEKTDSGSVPHVVPSRQKSVAVLYFENQSGEKEDEYFRDGITEDIVTELSKISQLEIFPRSEMLAFRDKPITALQVG